MTHLFTYVNSQTGLPDMPNASAKVDFGLQLQNGKYTFNTREKMRLKFSHVFTARCYASAVLAMALCPSVRVRVCHKSEFY